MDPPAHYSIYCVASTLGGQRCCKAFGRAFGRAFAELCTELRAELLEGFGRARRRAFTGLNVLKFVTWILLQPTARKFFSNQLEAVSQPIRSWLGGSLNSRTPNPNI